MLHVFREFGMGKNLMEERVSACGTALDEYGKNETQVLLEVTDLLEKCKKDANKKLDLRQYFHAAVGSVINSILFGYRFGETNMSDFLYLKETLDRIMEIYARPEFIMWMFFPILRYIPFFWNFNKGAKENNDILFGMIDSQIEAHKAEIDFDSEKSTDYVEAFLKEQKRHENEPDFGGMNQLRNTCIDLWAAGMETTSNTLYWGVLYVLMNPEVQRNIHEEMDREIGSQRLITIADRSLLHYMNAVIAEIQRSANLLPLNVFHETTEDVVIDGHHIPAKTLFLPQISSVMYDEKV
ncbi:unnamed protein product [Strongylus vulgaris]|uniref:Uncharacterized protein n=1 Tax=Strongylus vulgaris TaxID=40348 RepID=A0A3P7INW9_STRVU|nr:unnamed protein product [Strongylus vulgaris]